MCSKSMFFEAKWTIKQSVEVFQNLDCTSELSFGRQSAGGGRFDGYN